MKIEELKALVSKHISEDEDSSFRDLLNGEDSVYSSSEEKWVPFTIKGYVFESIVSERINSEVQCVFKVDGKFYEIYGSYDSQEGRDFYDLTDFYEVEPKQKTITVYEKI